MQWTGSFLVCEYILAQGTAYSILEEIQLGGGLHSHE